MHGQQGAKIGMGTLAQLIELQVQGQHLLTQYSALRDLTEQAHHQLFAIRADIQLQHM